jgi:hypothetical protein
MSKITLHPSNDKLAYFEYKQRQCLIMYYKGGVNIKILIQIFKQLDIMTSYYSRVSVVLLQFHLREQTLDNKVISIFLTALIKKLKFRYKSKIGYVWIREQNGAPAQHYHMAIMLSGHVCESSHHIYTIAKEIWKTQNENGYSYRVENSLYRLVRYCDIELNAARYRLSYFAKNRTKVFDKDIKKFGVSRLAFNVPMSTTRS